MVNAPETFDRDEISATWTIIAAGAFMIFLALFRSGSGYYDYKLLLWGGMLLLAVGGIRSLTKRSGQTPQNAIVVRPIPTAPASLSLDILRKSRGDLTDVCAGADVLKFFDPDATELKSAWVRGNTTELEGLLRSGDALNRRSWQESFRRFNKAAQAVDQLRSSLEQALRSAKPVMARLGMPAPTIPAYRSAESYGTAFKAEMAPPWTAQINMTRGLGVNAARVARDPRLLPVAAAIYAGAFVLKRAGQSKHLRSLKEAEGIVATQAVAMQADVHQMRAIVETRMLAGFDLMLRAIEDLRAVVGKLANPDAPLAEDSAAHFKIAVREACRLIEQRAGD